VNAPVASPEGPEAVPVTAELKEVKANEGTQV
jgi:hypothetical protein